MSSEENTEIDEKKPEDSSPKREDFQLSRFTIKVKLLAIISAITILAMSVMILLASEFFRDDSEKRVQENNLNLANTIGFKSEFQLKTLSRNARILVSAEDTPEFRSIFFKNNPEIIFVGILARDKSGPRVAKSYINNLYLAGNNLDLAGIRRLHGLNLKFFEDSFGGQTVVQNISPGFEAPMIGISLPLAEQGEVLVVYIDAADFLKSFSPEEGGGITLTFMVNGRGEVLAHPKGELVLSRGSLAELEIVASMVASKVSLGQKAYLDRKGERWLGSYKKFDFGSLGIISTAREEEVFKSVTAIRNRNLLILLISVNVVLLVIYFFSQTLTTPIRKLVGATHQIEEGNFHLDIKPSARDEVGLLTSSFVKMAQGLDEREKIKDAMGRFVNPEIAELAMKGEIKLGGEKRDCAIFFSDLRGFTAMSEKMQPEEVVHFLNEYFTGMVGCVNDTKGTVDKFIGDAIMAHWGAFTSHDEDGNEIIVNNTENAIQAALMMRDVLIQFNKNGEGKRPFAKMGSGINTGPVIAGQIGSDTRLEFTVIGDAVNLASRIEALNKPFGTDVLISADSLKAVEGIYKLEEMPAIKVKGKSEPQAIYAVVGRLDDPNCPANMDQVRDMLGIDKPLEVKSADEGEVKYEIMDK